MKKAAAGGLIVAACLITGCSSTPHSLQETHGSSSLRAIQQRCVLDRRQVIGDEWSDYEWRTHRQVIYPNWRGETTRWARLECKRGRRIEAFHP